VILKCIIIEDEPLAIEKLEGFIIKTPVLLLNKSFNNAIDGLNYLQNNTVDVVFLDIQMEHLTGIQMLESLTKKPYIIITSAYAQYALKGYELRVFDYLLKPFGFDRFISAVNKVVDDVNLKKAPVEGQKTYLFVKTENRLEQIHTSEILYIEGMREYLRIVLPGKKIMTKQSFKGILDQLPDKQFVQVHKSWVVHVSKINSIEKNRIKIGEILIPIGETFKKEIREFIIMDNV
jgi:DNA-binding LytR/AlgR family response regulator